MYPYQANQNMIYANGDPVPQSQSQPMPNYQVPQQMPQSYPVQTQNGMQPMANPGIMIVDNGALNQYGLPDYPKTKKPTDFHCRYCGYNGLNEISCGIGIWIIWISSWYSI